MTRYSVDLHLDDNALQAAAGQAAVAIARAMEFQTEPPPGGEGRHEGQVELFRRG